MTSPPLLVYRFGNICHRFRVPVLPSIATIVNRLWFGCYLPSSAILGKGVRLGYWGLGVVIHARAQIGDGALIRQNVTIGTKYIGGGVPRIEANVVVGAGAVILGDIVIGARSVVGANSVVLHNIPPDTTVVGAPARPVLKGD